MRFFLVWNGAYKRECYFAETIEQALVMAVKARHIKRTTHYRKWVDATDLMDLEPDPASLADVMASGCDACRVKHFEGVGWKVLDR